MISESSVFTYITTLETGFLVSGICNCSVTYIIVAVNALKLSNGMCNWPSFSSP